MFLFCWFSATYTQNIERKGISQTSVEATAPFNNAKLHLKNGKSISIPLDHQPRITFEGNLLSIKSAGISLKAEHNKFKGLTHTNIQESQARTLNIYDYYVSFDNQKDTIYDAITYTRYFNNTHWQAWCMPFETDYTTLKEHFDVAYINDVHQYDDNDDGIIDRLEVEIIRITDGTLQANTPYLIKSKEIQEKEITLYNSILRKAEPKRIDYSSVNTLYTFKGNYSTISDEIMIDNNYYALSSGTLKKAQAGASLKPFRWILKIEARNNPYSLPEVIKIVEKRLTDIKTPTLLQITNNTIEIEGISGNSIVNLYNAEGKSISSNKATESGKISIDTNHLPNGIYIITTNNNTYKFIKQ